MHKQFFILLLTSFLCCTSTESCFSQQDIFVRKVEVVKDLPPFEITDITEDQYGFLWIASEEGLIKFDGKNYVWYKSDPGDSTRLQHHYVNTLHIDRHNNLWVGTHNGLHLYDYCKNEFIWFKPDQHKYDWIRGKFINDLVEDHSGIIWIATYRGLTRLDYLNREFTTYDQTNSALPTRDITALYMQQDGAVLLGTKNFGIWKLEDGVFTKSGIPELDSKLIWDVLPDQNGILWVATQNNGIYKIDQDGNFETFFNTTEVKYLQKVVGKNEIISNGMLLSKKISVPEQIIIRSNEGRQYYSWIRFFRSSKNVNWIFTDHGIFVEDTIRQMKTISQDIFPPKFNTIANITAVDFSTEFLAYKIESSGAYMHNFKYNKTREIFYSGYFWEYKNELLFDNQNVFYLKKDGLYGTTIENNNSRLIINGNFRFYLSGPDDRIYVVPETDKLSSVTIYDPDNDTLNDIPVKSKITGILPKLGIVGARMTSDSVIWLLSVEGESGLSGLVRKLPSDDNFEYVARKTEKTNNIFIHDICLAPNGKYILATEHGLAVYNTAKNEISSFSDNNDFNFNFKSIYPLDNKHIICISSTHIFRLNVFTKEMFRYEISTEQANLSFNLRAVARGPQGKLYIGHSRGVLEFDPDYVEELPRNPQVIISEISYLSENMQRVIFNPTLCGVRHVLPAGNSGLKFIFTTPGIPSGHQLKYRYFLEGTDTSWQSTSEDVSAEYAHLRQGKPRRFKVQLMDNEHVLSETSVVVVTKNDKGKLIQVATFILIILMMGAVILILKKDHKRRSVVVRQEPELNSDDNFIERLNWFIDQHMDDQNLGTAGIEKTFGMSRTGLYRLLKEKTGKSVTAYIREYRLEKAEELLKSGKYTVSEIIYRVGFNSRSYFYKCYREKFGRGPRE